MKKQILLSLFLLLFSHSYSQKNNLESTSAIDTLKYLTSHYQYHKAIEYIEKQEPTRNILTEKARCYKSMGDYNKSAMILSDLAEQYPRDIHILNELALSYQAIKRWEEGEKCYDLLMELDSTNVYFRTKRGDMLYNQSKYKQAIDTYMQLYIETPTPALSKQIGRCYEAINKKDSARLYYNKAWEHDFSDSQAAVLYTNFSLKHKDILTALDVCRTYTKQDSMNFQMNRLHALTYYVLESYTSAASLFEKCLLEGDSTLIVNQSLGLCYFSLKDPKAYEVLHRAYEQDSTNNSVLYGLASVCNDLKKTKEAINYFSILLDRVMPKHNILFLYYRGLATAYANNEEYKAAIAQYKEALHYGTKNQQSLMQIAIAELYDLNLNDKKNALKYYKLFQIDLEKFITQLKEEKVIDFNQLKDAEHRLKALNEYMKQLGN